MASARMTSRRLVAATALAAGVLMVAPSLASASADISLVGPTLTAQGSAGDDSVVVRYYVPGEEGPNAQLKANEPSYLFGAQQPTFFGKDATVRPGPGCSTVKHEQHLVACPAAGVTQINLLLGDGADFANAGNGGGMPPIAVTIRGGSGDDQMFSDAKSNGEHKLFGEEGNDSLQAFSSTVRARMDGGVGNDVFGWEGTARGTPTTADGGPGDDRFSARNARGAETISGGPGADEIDVFDNGAGDRDTVACGDGLDALTADSGDMIAGDCEPAPTNPRLEAAIEKDTAAAKSRLRTTTLRSLASRGLALSLSGPFVGSYTAELTASTPQASASAFKRIAKASRRVAKPGRVRLTLRLTSAGRALARRSPRLKVRLQITYTASRPFGQIGKVRSRSTGATLKSRR